MVYTTIEPTDTGEFSIDSDTLSIDKYELVHLNILGVDAGTNGSTSNSKKLGKAWQIFQNGLRKDSVCLMKERRFSMETCTSST